MPPVAHTCAAIASNSRCRADIRAGIIVRISFAYTGTPMPRKVGACLSGSPANNRFNAGGAQAGSCACLEGLRLRV